MHRERKRGGWELQGGPRVGAWSLIPKTAVCTGEGGEGGGGSWETGALSWPITPSDPCNVNSFLMCLGRSSSGPLRPFVEQLHQRGLLFEQLPPHPNTRSPPHKSSQILPITMWAGLSPLAKLSALMETIKATARKEFPSSENTLYFVPTVTVALLDLTVLGTRCHYLLLQCRGEIELWEKTCFHTPLHSCHALNFPQCYP